MVSEDPAIVVHFIKGIDHDGALRLVALDGALVDVSDIEEEVVWAVLPPLADLGGAAGETADVSDAIVGLGGQDVAMEIGGVEERDRLNGAPLCGE